MPGWIMHLRVADAIQQRFSLNDRLFLAGNIAPDCGDILPDGGYAPKKSVTHWQDANGCSDVPDFLAKHAAHAPREALPFYLGYACHLWTDEYWKQLIVFPLKEKYPEQDTRRFRQDWSDADMLWYREHAPFDPLERFSAIGDFPNIYLPYFEEDTLTRSFREKAYLLHQPQKDLDREYPYVNVDRIDLFVKQAAENIAGMLPVYLTD